MSLMERLRKRIDQRAYRAGFDDAVNGYNDAREVFWRDRASYNEGYRDGVNLKPIIEAFLNTPLEPT